MFHVGREYFVGENAIFIFAFCVTLRNATSVKAKQYLLATFDHYLDHLNPKMIRKNNFRGTDMQIIQLFFRRLSESGKIHILCDRNIYVLIPILLNIFNNFRTSGLKDEVLDHKASALVSVMQMY